jgi:Domain of unknown function (DUF1338)
MQSYPELLNRLWLDYRSANPKITTIYDLLVGSGERVVNDHVAFRTINDPRVNISVLAQIFEKLGYQACQEYHFDEKHLVAWHFEHPDLEAPRVFISALELSQCSQGVRNTLTRCIDQIDEKVLKQPGALLLAKAPWQPLSYEIYQSLLAESEYAAWLYVFGYRANHFTVSVNALKNPNIHVLNQWIESQGFELNASGGVVKGTREEMLEQSSTLAELVDVAFQEGVYRVPCCYYEFAKRYPGVDGRLYSGFIAKSADKIFESTHARRGC